MDKPVSQVSVFDLANLRIGLEQIKDPSPLLVEAISNLDVIIHDFTCGLISNKGN